MTNDRSAGVGNQDMSVNAKHTGDKTRQARYTTTANSMKKHICKAEVLTFSNHFQAQFDTEDQQLCQRASLFQHITLVSA